MELTGEIKLCERFEGLQRRFERVRPMVDQASRWQVELLKETRRNGAGETDDAAADDHELRGHRTWLDRLRPAGRARSSFVRMN
ncbi:MAG: hypothetical protein U1F47_09770 [Hyphomicrobiales bacterium]